MKQLFLALAATLVAVSGVNGNPLFDKDAMDPNNDFCVMTKIKLDGKQKVSDQDRADFKRCLEGQRRLTEADASKGKTLKLAVNSQPKTPSTLQESHSQVTLSALEMGQVVRMCGQLGPNAPRLCRDPRFADNSVGHR